MHRRFFFVMCLVFMLVAGLVPGATAQQDPYALISQDMLFEYLEGLVNVQPYSGWRNSASSGEAEAIDYVAATLESMPQLAGLELERQSFNVFVSTEIWQSQLELTIGGERVEVPADSIRGSRDNVARALRYDTDGVANDSDHDPQTAEGEVVLVQSEEQIGPELDGRIVVVDYALIDRSVRSRSTALQTARRIWSQNPAGVVVVTQFSNTVGESHGFAIGDLSVLSDLDGVPAVPTLYVRIEDVPGIESWDDLVDVQHAELTVDVDVFAPGTGHNLIARIPGQDSSRAMILGAHIDSPNSPGALDNGSGSAVLMEVARVIGAANVQPPFDLYLVWFGAEEIGLYGSGHFVSTHQELLDRTIAMLSVDCLTSPLDGVELTLDFNAWSYARMGIPEIPWADYLQDLAADSGIETTVTDVGGISSDNASFSMYDVPNVNMINGGGAYNLQAYGSIHYLAHLHSPYDTVERAREQADVLENMTQVALRAALEPGDRGYRVTMAPIERAVIVASHTEAVHLTSVAMVDFSMTLAALGYDVDVIPFGQEVTPTDLEGAGLVMVLPVIDYADADGAYDVGWSEAEVDAIEGYVNDGGFLILTNAAQHLNFFNAPIAENEDWADMNMLSTRFGIEYTDVTLGIFRQDRLGQHELLENMTGLEIGDGTAVQFSMEAGEVLVGAGPDDPFLALVEQGGEVLVVGDLGIFLVPINSPQAGTQNLRLWFNIARYGALR